MAPSLGKMDAAQQTRAGRFAHKDRWLRRYSATAVLLGRLSRAFWCQLPDLFHGYLASVLSGARASSFHAKHGKDCERLLSSGRSVGDHYRLGIGLLDPEGLHAYSGTQDDNGNRFRS